MELYLVRHGETEWSRARRHTGRTDLPLSPVGEAEARALVAELTASDGRALLFGHGHQLRILTACYLGLSPEAARHLFLGTASVSALGVEHEWPAILLWNEQEGSGAHLAEAGTTGWRGVPG